MKKQQYRLTRDVTPAECSWLGTCTVRKGVIATEVDDRYGCCTPAGVLVKFSENGVPTEIPQTALGALVKLELV